MNYSRFTAFKRFKGFLYDMLSRLSKHLNGNIIGNKIFFNQCSCKFVFRFACRREAYFYFFKTNFYKIGKKFELFFQIHWNNERLVAVSQINTAPNRRFFDIFLFSPSVSLFRRHKIASFVVLYVFHN